MKPILLFLFLSAACGVRAQIKLDNVAAKKDYDSMCVVGKRYTICGYPEKNPFEKRAIANVIIVAKKDGYVQYCWDYDYKKHVKALYSRSCEEFIFMMNLCLKK